MFDISFTASIHLLEEYFPNLAADQQLDLDLDRIVHVLGNFVYPEYPIICRPKEGGLPYVRAMGWGVIEYFAPAALDKLTSTLGDPQ